jgi:tRNA threonylcarbamoyladenosine biosynthesis protein TsaE
VVIALRGPLGAGKTAFVKGLAEGLGLDPGIVSSPTFVVSQEYPCLARGVRLVHLDLYRLERTAELEATGFLDVLDGESIVAIEWADRLPDALPSDRLEIDLAASVELGEKVREISVVATGLVAESVMRRWGLCLGVAGTVELENVACP